MSYSPGAGFSYIQLLTMTAMSYDLERFVTAQHSIYAKVLAELRNGQKTGCWMWYIFPQIRGLGESDNSRFYAISSCDEARAYIEHSILGPRLRECTKLVSCIAGKSLTDIFGPVDAIKFCSSMALFCQTTPDSTLFRRGLDQFCEGRLDQATIKLLDCTDQL
jgi:uncharacterized protein (DUF1810 family)